MMDRIGEDGLFRHRVPVPLALRIFLVAAGLFVIFVATWELYRGVWPFNFASPFFLFLILGAWSVGGPVAWAGLNGASGLWIVGPGRITIERKRPFLKLRQDVFGDDDGMRLEVVEMEAMEGDSTWSVVLIAADGRRFETRELRTRAAAERLRDRIEAAFTSKEPLKPTQD
ncbi:hypothetical protein [Shinella kummerowiae]|jgi:hypothetical protein|uniref:hypothetical protein n=1 Tax=Shinella kummerowiae TaxID=417745 RepID=UPI0021B55042|nr:hypothetical protein [Shinella kummerowiae]MCT7662621.1 hypothetical protein [Shinella kummerowiae]